MTKGFKENNKFHPTVHTGGRSSKEKSTKPEGMLLERRKLKFAPEGEIAPLNDIRIKGNKIIENIVSVSKQVNPEYSDFVINNTNIYNDYDEIQKTFAFSEEQINQLLEWRLDGNPKTWKWESPIVLENPSNESDFAILDNHNSGFIGDAYKGRTTITIMTPEEYLTLACPKCLEEYKSKGVSGIDFDVRGKEFTQKNISELTKLMEDGEPIDTPYIEISGNDVVGHEGRHRAISAIEAGIEKIPVYIYNRDEFDDDARRAVTDDPINELNADTRD